MTQREAQRAAVVNQMRLRKLSILRQAAKARDEVRKRAALQAFKDANGTGTVSGASEDRLSPVDRATSPGGHDGQG